MYAASTASLLTLCACSDNGDSGGTAGRARDWRVPFCAIGDYEVADSARTVLPVAGHHGDEDEL